MLQKIVDNWENKDSFRWKWWGKGKPQRKQTHKKSHPRASKAEKVTVLEDIICKIMYEMSNTLMGMRCAKAPFSKDAV